MCVRGVMYMYNCVERGACAFIFTKCCFTHLIGHSLVNVHRSVSVDVHCHHLPCLPPFRFLLLSLSLLRFHDVPEPHLCPWAPPLSLSVPAPHAVANFRPASIYLSILLVMPCTALKLLSWMCFTECSNPPSGTVEVCWKEERWGSVIG